MIVEQHSYVYGDRWDSDPDYKAQQIKAAHDGAGMLGCTILSDEPERETPEDVEDPNVILLIWRLETNDNPSG